MSFGRLIISRVAGFVPAMSGMDRGFMPFAGENLYGFPERS
jgi:hypothetical protein